MDDTSDTVANLIIDFRDGYSRGGQQRLLRTIDQRLRRYCVTDPEYGAIGNGKTNPASTVYSSLHALQLAYPRVNGGITVNGVSYAAIPVALTMELDWLGHQEAIYAAMQGGTLDAAGAGGMGGQVYTPRGSYVMSNSHSVADGSGTVQFPNAGEPGTGAAVGPQIDWIGDGIGNTRLAWPSDLGAGIFAVNFGTSKNTNQCFGVMQNIALKGPGAVVAMGAANCAMHGIGWSGRRRLDHVFVESFCNGVQIDGDQTLFKDVTCRDCFYGLYFNDQSAATYFNNHSFVRLVLTGNYKACVGVHTTAIIGECQFFGVTMTTTPFGFFKEGTGFVLFDGVSIYGWQMENIGNAAIGDAQLGSNPTCAVYNSVIEGASFTWNAAYKIGALAAPAILCINDLHNTRVFDLRSANGGQWGPGSASTFKILGATNSVIVGDRASVKATALAATLPVMSGGVGDILYTYTYTQP